MSGRASDPPDAGWRDATRALPSGHPVWPGDAPFALRPTARIPDGSSVNLSSLSGSVHLGTHLDAPWHVREDGAPVESVPLEAMIGDAVLVDVAAGRGAIGPDELPAGPWPPRVLFRTGQPDRWAAFPTEIRPIAPDTVARLADGGVRLIGTDAPSVDPLDDATLRAHHACFGAGVAIVEGLALERLSAGPYELICLPLALVGTDAAPARAVVRPRDADRRRT